MKCPRCKFYNICKGRLNETVENCVRFKSVEQTNEEWLKQCTTEQLAKVLYNFFMARTFCHLCPEEGVCDIGYECKYDSGEVEDFVEWLKQPYSPK